MVNLPSDYFYESGMLPTKNLLLKRNTPLPIFYSSFWGHSLKNKTDQLFNWVKSDIKDVTDSCQDLRGREFDIYRYQEHREDFVTKFFGDFLTYLNTDAGVVIRKQLLSQFQDFLDAHRNDREIVFVAHSLGTLILWELLFCQHLPENDPAQKFRQMFGSKESQLKLHGVITMGSPLLFMRLKQDIDFSAVDDFNGTNETLPWVNIIHASDLIAYPLGNAIKHDKASKLFFSDQYLWMHANAAESGALRFGQAHAGMALGLADAHGSYWNNDVVADLTASLLAKDLNNLATSKVHTGWRSYATDLRSV